MNTPAKLTAYVLGLAVLFGAAFVVGAAVGGVDTPPATEEHGTHDETATTPAGLQTSEKGHGAHRETAAVGDVFYAEVPSRGDRRLFLDFKHDGQVRTAAFTVRTASGHAQ